MGTDAARPAPGGGVGVPGTLTGLARLVVTDLAPDELPMFDDVCHGWLAGDPGRSRPGGGAIGFGVDPHLLSLVVLPVLTGALGEVIASVATAGSRSLWRRRRRPDPVLPPVTAAEAERIREACRTRAAAAGLSRRRAELLADAVVGALLGTPESPKADR